MNALNRRKTESSPTAPSSKECSVEPAHNDDMPMILAGRIKGGVVVAKGLERCEGVTAIVVLDPDMGELTAEQLAELIRRERARWRNDLEKLAGTWTEEEFREFEANTRMFGQVDPELWR